MTVSAPPPKADKGRASPARKVPIAKRGDGRPPRLFKPDVWPGEIVTPAEVQEAAGRSRLALVKDPDFAAAAAIFNRGLGRFMTLEQDADGAAQVGAWWRRLALHAERLFGEIHDDGAEHPLTQAIATLQSYAKAFDGTNFDLVDDLEFLAARLPELKQSAVRAAALCDAAAKKGRRPNHGNRVLGEAIVGAYAALTGNRSGGYSKPGSRSGAYGPLLDFGVALAAAAASVMECSDLVGWKNTAKTLRIQAASNEQILAMRDAATRTRS